MGGDAACLEEIGSEIWLTAGRPSNSTRDRKRRSSSLLRLLDEEIQSEFKELFV